MLKQILLLIVGLIVAPIFWLLQTLGVTKPPPKLTGIFESLNTHLVNEGIVASGEMQSIKLENVKEVAAFRIGFNPSPFNVVTVTLSENNSVAELVEAEAKQAPQYTSVCRNGPLVMACTFSPANSDLEIKIQSAFQTYKHAL